MMSVLAPMPFLPTRVFFVLVLFFLVSRLPRPFAVTLVLVLALQNDKNDNNNMDFRSSAFLYDAGFNYESIGDFFLQWHK